MATLLPVPEQQWISTNGDPVAGGTVAFYIPGTMTPKDTYQDSGATILNTNPVTLDAAGRAIIYGSGVYRVIVKDADGNQIYDQLTADTAAGGLSWGGTSTGTPNAQIIGASSFTQQDGQQISFLVGSGLTNTGALTVSLGGSGGVPILFDSPIGPVALTGGEVAAGNAVTLIYDGIRGAFHMVQNDLAPTPAGQVAMYAMVAVPNGWLICDGTAISRSVYARLFSAIGTTYGAGNGTTTFNVPDARGYFPRAWDDGAGRDSGRAIGSTQADAFKSHTHGVTDPTHAHPVPTRYTNGTDNAAISSQSTTVTGTTFATSAASTGISIQATGASETRPMNIAFMFAIKT